MTDYMTTQQTSAIYQNSQQAPAVNKNYTSKEQAREAAEKFEAFFVSQSLESMFSGIQTDTMFGGGHAEKVYRSMMLDEYGKTVAKSKGIGIADEVMRCLIESQQVSAESGEK